MNMKKTRRNKKQKGGTKSMEIYATMMQNKEYINADEFKAFLDNIPEPLIQDYSFDNTNTKYTIVEWALLCGVDNTILNVFCNYKFNLSRRINYPFNKLYNKDYPNSLIEAYILLTNHLPSIHALFTQLETESEEVINTNMHYIWGSCIPTIIHTIFTYIRINEKTESLIVSGIVYGYYLNKKALASLTKNYDEQTIYTLYYYAVLNSSLGLMELIYSCMDDIFIIEATLTDDILSGLIIQDNSQIYKSVLHKLNTCDKNILGAIVCKTLGITNSNCNTQYIQSKYGIDIDDINNKEFIEKLGGHIINNMLLPEINKKDSIIVISHGMSRGKKIETEFNMNRLCFFAGQGCLLEDISKHSRPIEQLICAGHYNKTKQCEKSENGKIITEDIILSFTPTDLEQERKEYLGVYICSNGKVNKMNGNIQKTGGYTIGQIIDYCSQIASFAFENINEVELLIYSCIGYENTTKKTTIKPFVIQP